MWALLGCILDSKFLADYTDEDDVRGHVAVQVAFWLGFKGGVERIARTDDFGWRTQTSMTGVDETSCDKSPKSHPHHTKLLLS
ncbi:MAG: hypothetical protein Q8M25_03010 [Rhodoferax sp.]|nr:hypothetical protein [Rhodoferax sp.]